MQDFVPLGTGNSRSLKSAVPAGTTWEQALAMLRNGTFPIDIGAVNEAGVSQKGTPLNKATLLRDETASALGLPNTAVPDDVFGALTGSLKSHWEFIECLSNLNSMSGTWTAPDLFDGNNYDLGVYEIGGGGSGALCVNTSGNSWAAGGASGYGKNFIIGNVTPGTQFSYVIGAGGAARTTTSAVATGGNSGGTTSFNNVSVSGGMGGQAVSNNAGVQGSSGGQGSDAGANIFQNNRALYGCCQTNDNNEEGASGGLSQSPREGQNQFNPNMITLSAGGFANGYMGRYQTILAMPSGAKGGNGSNNGEDATGYGNGGGAGVSRSSQTRKSGAGSDGAIFLYARRRGNS